jgi:hypothetical protein
MGFARKAIVAAGLGFVLAAVVGCGSSSSLLSSEQASQLKGTLASARDALSARECSTAADYVDAYRNQVNSLSGVNQTLVDNLNQGGSTIAQLAATDCPVRTTTRSHTTTTNTNTDRTPTVTTNTNTTPTVTTNTSTTPTVTTNTDTIPPPSGGTGLGGPQNQQSRFGHGGWRHEGGGDS